MKLKKLYRAVLPVAALCFACAASAQDNRWNGTATNNLWNVPGNWSLGVVPVPGNPTNTFTGNVFLDPANGNSTIVIPAGDVETPGVGNSTEVFNSIFGPEFGANLDIYGSLTFDWLLFPAQNDPAPANRSHLNLRDNAVVTTSGAAVGIGDSWFYWAAPYETMNLYSNAQYNSVGGAGLWIAGHLNVYDNAQFYVNGYINMESLGAQSDGTRSIVVGGGALIVPENSLSGGNSGTVYDWIGRGILRAYGKAYDTNDLVITDETTNIVITPVPLGGALQRVYLMPLVRTNVNIGDFQQSTLVGDYPGVSGVLLGSSEPGISPTSFPHPTYTSSNPKVFTVDTNGMVTATGFGTATLTAQVGAFNSTNSVSLTVSPSLPHLIHRYSFSESAGATTTADSVGGMDGMVNGDATFSGGQLVLSGNVGSSVTLPAGIVSNADEVTIEAWASFPSTNAPFANLWAFGFSDNIPFDANIGAGGNYITFSPHTGGSVAQANFGQGLPGSNGERDVAAGGVLDNQTNVHIVVVFHPFAGSESVYLNGSLAGTTSMFNNMIDPIAFMGPTYSNRSILNYILGGGTNNFIGQSLYTADPGILANVDEFRIYDMALTPGQIAADHALGANQLPGTNTAPVSLVASISGTNTVLKWPTASALVNVMASPTLGSGAVWTPATGTLTTDGSTNYLLTIPTSGSARFFRLQQ